MGDERAETRANAAGKISDHESLFDLSGRCKTILAVAASD
jgi:hypothetical protein